MIPERMRSYSRPCRIFGGRFSVRRVSGVPVTVLSRVLLNTFLSVHSHSRQTVAFAANPMVLHRNLALRGVSFALAFMLLAVFSIGCQPAAEEEMPVEEAPAPVVLTDVWVLEEGLNRPESAVYDAARDVLYVSNINFDGPGSIAKVSTDGMMVDSMWVSDLSAPKGIELGGDILYVADENTLLEIDLDSGEILAEHVVEGDEVYLNDVTVGEDGAVYVSDSRFSKVYALQDGSFDVWLEHGNVLVPNGVHVIGDELYIAAADSTAEEPGQARYLQAISFADMSVRALHGTEPEGALDAVEPDGMGGLFVSDWGGGRLLHFRDGEGLTLLRTPGQGTADVEFVTDTQMLYVPVMMSDQLLALKVSM